MFVLGEAQSALHSQKYSLSDSLEAEYEALKAECRAQSAGTEAALQQESLQRKRVPLAAIHSGYASKQHDLQTRLKHSQAHLDKLCNEHSQLSHKLSRLEAELEGLNGQGSAAAQSKTRLLQQRDELTDRLKGLMVSLSLLRADQQTSERALHLHSMVDSLKRIFPGCKH